MNKALRREWHVICRPISEWPMSCMCRRWLVEQSVEVVYRKMTLMAFIFTTLPHTVSICEFVASASRRLLLSICLSNWSESLHPSLALTFKPYLSVIANVFLRNFPPRERRSSSGTGLTDTISIGKFACATPGTYSAWLMRSNTGKVKKK